MSSLAEGATTDQEGTSVAAYKPAAGSPGRNRVRASLLPARSPPTVGPPPSVAFPPFSVFPAVPLVSKPT
jgi:hypothetical protein